MAALSGALGNEARRWSLEVEGSGEKGSWEPLPRGCQQWTSGSLAVMYILAHLATFLPKMLQMLPDVYWRSGEGKKSSPHTPAET